MNQYLWLEQKRIKHEIKNDLSEMIIDMGYIVNNTQYSYFSNENFSDIRNSKNKNLFIKFQSKIFNNIKIYMEISDRYPFRLPNKIQVNNEDYINLLKIPGQYLELVNVTKCLCCSSITCSNNWSVGNKLIDIINEVESIIEMKKRIVYLICCRVIKRKYLNHDIDIERYIK
ncbi:hypothetical protein CPAV1605_1232 [seawater metagenome]|uniref:Uncharacterized protein n=1 Tax=seawater metagenome TaxID=1561972 RepID=A0A5E8CJL4_9ZZZZ